MLRYETLSKGQKRMVDAFVKAHPELLKSQTITFAECIQIFRELYEQRKEGSPKVGFPNWLLLHNRVSRGVYWFPHPKQDQLAHRAATKAAKKTVSKAGAKKVSEAPAAKKNGKSAKKEVEHSPS